jgi:predicted alpha-1,2-mannosidase
LRQRSGNWRNVFDPRTKYAQGRHEDGTFLDEDNYLKKTSFITEGTPCHYSWFVPQDVEGLIEFVGRDLFEERLDLMFSENRYWHGNEPGNQIAYMYDYIGRPEKCQKAVQEIMRTEYRNTPGGLSGNDDAGQLSAWYVFTCLGFYPVCPGSAEYALGIPAFDKIVLHLENGRDFTIVRKAGKTAFRLGCRRLRRPFISHRDIVKGKKLTFYCE